jgi:hypothetical protein
MFLVKGSAGSDIATVPVTSGVHGPASGRQAVRAEPHWARLGWASARPVVAFGLARRFPGQPSRQAPAFKHTVDRSLSPLTNERFGPVDAHAQH